VLEDDGAEEPEPEEDVFHVWPEHVEAVELFCALATQWRVAAGFGGVMFLGLHYPAVESAMRLRGVKPKDRARLFAELRVMEAAAAAELNRRRDG
jgi:hypothetical protein